MQKDERQLSNLTSYAALLGNSFASKIDLLTQIVQKSHYPSIGRYKEKLLSKAITEYIPRNFEVGTGFVLFPSDKLFEEKPPKWFDPLNISAHTLSKQCDIIVYDSSSFPVIFRDEDFVVLRPESVKAVIEVKGSLSVKEVNSCLEGILDFGRKWRECQIFYKHHSQELVPRPSMYVMAWDFARTPSGKPKTNGTKIRKQIVKFYREQVDLEQLKGLPMLDKLLVYNECEVSLGGWTEERSEVLIFRQGWHTFSGRFIRFQADGQAKRSGDRTIASLLAGIHYSLGTNFNRFFSYMDETRQEDLAPYEHEGFDYWLEEGEEKTGLIRAANSDTP